MYLNWSSTVNGDNYTDSGNGTNLQIPTLPSMQIVSKVSRGQRLTLFKYLCIYMKVKFTECARDRAILICWFTPENATTPRLQHTESRSFSQAFFMGDRSLNTWASSGCFSQAISRVFDCKWNSRAVNQGSCGMQVSFLSSMSQHWHPCKYFLRSCTMCCALYSTQWEGFLFVEFYGPTIHF